MGFGKVLAIISGILSLLAIFLLTWVDSASPYLYGIGVILEIPSAFGRISAWTGYLFLVLEFLLLLSFVFQLIGAKVKVLSILGGLIPFVVGVFFILDVFLSVGFISTFVTDFSAICGTHTALVDGFIPLNIGFGGLSLGIVLITLAALLSIISGFMSRDDF